MFKNNKYTKIYYQIISNASNRINEGYIEKHHIVPKSCGGTNDADNLVELSAREHFICHWLLIKMTEGGHLRDMHYAFKMMSQHGKTTRLRRIAKQTGARWSEKSKQKLSVRLKKDYASGKRKPVKAMLGKKLTKEQREKVSIALKGKKKSAAHIKAMSKVNKGKTWRVVNGKRKWFDV